LECGRLKINGVWLNRKITIEKLENSLDGFLEKEDKETILSWIEIAKLK